MEEFKELVRAEMTAVSQRLARHPSLVLWSGNNESPVCVSAVTVSAANENERASKWVYCTVCLGVRG